MNAAFRSEPSAPTTTHSREEAFPTGKEDPREENTPPWTHTNARTPKRSFTNTHMLTHTGVCAFSSNIQSKLCKYYFLSCG